MTAPSVRNEPWLKQPPTLERMEYEAPWKIADPDGVEVEIHLWADRDRRDGEVRIPNGLVLGAIADVSRDKATLDPAPDAIKHYGPEWVDAQLLYGQALLASRLSRR